MAIRCIKVGLKLEPTNYEYWNALGIITMLVDAKISQHCFIKAIEFNVLLQVTISSCFKLFYCNFFCYHRYYYNSKRKFGFFF
jgi:hypothetical protein